MDYFKNTKEEKRYQITTFEDNDYKTNYKGKIIILTNTNTASAAELFVMDASLFENVIILGTNTMGGLDFGSNLLYELPNSKITVSIPAVSLKKADALQNNPNWHGDTMGFFPDYWTPNYRLLSTLIDITKDKKLKKVLQGLDDDLL